MTGNSSSQRQSKLGPCVFCFQCFESLHSPCGAVKRRWIVKLDETSKAPGSKTLKMAAIFRKGCWAAFSKGKMPFLTFVCPFCIPSPVYLFHYPIAHLCTKFGALDHSNNRNRCLEILSFKQLCSKTTFSPWGLFFSWTNVF